LDQARKLMQQRLCRLDQPLRRCSVEIRKLTWRLAKLNRDLIHVLTQPRYPGWVDRFHHGWRFVIV